MNTTKRKGASNMKPGLLIILAALLAADTSTASSAYSCSCAVTCNGLGGIGPLGHHGSYQATSSGAAASQCYSDAVDVCLKKRTGIVTDYLSASCR